MMFEVFSDNSANVQRLCLGARTKNYERVLIKLFVGVDYYISIINNYFYRKAMKIVFTETSDILSFIIPHSYPLMGAVMYSLLVPRSYPLIGAVM